ncbi:FGGY-family carbohydrate kinase [Corynebacterium choanae]|uniref:Ribulokinase n=1 Tax=Corynebacterium choanae TaxID=1862358 RepID=A0A3G6J8L2_9CORY|nr:FGGY-family carbohydrate kinase [Corynebacterium choanae]AZA13228.1 ribulokinase [Corynebacterium choanae]
MVSSTAVTAQSPDLQRCHLGVEFGSTRIKAILIDERGGVLAHGSYRWQPHQEQGLFSYHYDEAFTGLRQAYSAVKQHIVAEYGVTIRTLGSITISGMMHGYIPLGEDFTPVAAFRTWQNTNTGDAAAQLSAALEKHIPLRWSCAHYFQALLDSEPHISQTRYLTTLAGYIHVHLCGEFVLGLGDAAGMFPLAADGHRYDPAAIKRFDDLTEPLGATGSMSDLLPRPLPAGAFAGRLTEKGAQLLDPAGDLQAGIVLAPPEADAATSLVTTNVVTPGLGGISAGTSIFAMVVLDKPLAAPLEEVDIVATPDGHHVAMVHCNNCAQEIDAWADFVRSVITLTGQKCDDATLYRLLFTAAGLSVGDSNSYAAINYHVGEHSTQVTHGIPIMARHPDAVFALGPVMRSVIMSSFVTLRFGLERLSNKASMTISHLVAQGGVFTVPEVAQRILSGMLGVPIGVPNESAQGGAYGAALLGLYLATITERHEQAGTPGDSLDSVASDTAGGEIASSVQAAAPAAQQYSTASPQSLSSFLQQILENSLTVSTVEPDPATQEECDRFAARYELLLPIERKLGEIF